MLSERGILAINQIQGLLYDGAADYLLQQEPGEKHSPRWQMWRAEVHKFVRAKVVEDGDMWVELFGARKGEVKHLVLRMTNEIEKNKLAISERKLGAVTILTRDNLLTKGRIWRKVRHIAEKGFDRFMGEDSDFLFQHSQQFDTFVNAMKKVDTDEAQTEILLRDMPKDHRDALLDEFDELKKGIQLPERITNRTRKKVSDETQGFNKSKAKTRRGFEAETPPGSQTLEGDLGDSPLEVEYEINEPTKGRLVGDGGSAKEAVSYEPILTEEKRKRLNAIIEERENLTPLDSASTVNEEIVQETRDTRDARKVVDEVVSRKNILKYDGRVKKNR